MRKLAYEALEKEPGAPLGVPGSFVICDVSSSFVLFGAESYAIVRII